MPAECWGCATGLRRIDHDMPAQIGSATDPLGGCCVCRAFFCAGHAELDQISGKWTCSTSLARALAVHSGIDPQATTELEIKDRADLGKRFPATDAAITPEEPGIGNQFDRLGLAASTAKDRNLAAAAVALAMLLVEGWPEELVRDSSPRLSGVFGQPLAGVVSTIYGELLR
jgi:hypothetical protein